MIILDTNVLSEPLRTDPEIAVVAWMKTQTDAAVTAISVAELLVGARRLPAGARRERLIAAIDSILSGSRVLPFDERAARKYARLQEIRRIAGRPLSVEDGMIAAVAAAHGASLATRNTKDFEGLGIDLLDPWEAVDS
ncbi:type II toxin-antitoxin system VapC family toxin [Microbacterium sp. M3]|uniref:Ribonuclease VapC n=1 Tax=Microbacterium arthrosphaerae TaxID=792652 RepID=A0ABU4H393_9MICO|nr:MULTISPECIES: type II toxin-antitoxin system VapC family toxin [Microbacterium]MDW4573791.1 type II toxin-antitoxin system VapC family toxin [Microbacterium arthrosphaerae]MDW7607646.1 type II toxin-antitoxin system VapC family toxin [Microbacterium sp. M3]